jgi:hypothetical protein
MCTSFNIKMLRKSLLAVSTSSLLFLANSMTFAGVITDSLVVKMQTTEYGIAFVYLEDSKPWQGTRPSCSANNAAKGYVFDISTPGGKATLQNLLLAKATGAKVTVIGRGEYPATYPPADQACAIWNQPNGSGFEMINNVTVQ